MHETEPRLHAASRSSYATIWEWTLRGTNLEIGRALATHARDSLQTVPLRWPDRSRILAQRRFFETYFRPFHQRMLGVADALGTATDDCAYDLASLPFDVGRAGCSAGAIPRQQAASGHAHVLRNMDLGTDLTGKTDHPPASRIFALRMAPDEGYASLSAVVFDLMGAMDGINEKGLVVICNSHGDYRLTGSFQPEPAYSYDPARHPEPGLSELQVVRYLLDTCADTDEAKEALLSLRTYYMSIPCLYMVSDARGRSFVAEKSPSGNRVVLTERESEPLIMTNFALSRFERDDSMPEDDGLEQGFVYARYRILKEALAGQELLTTSQLAQIAHDASFDALCGPRSEGDLRPVRTIYSSLYDIDARTMNLSCYMGETEQGTARSNPVTFELGGTPQA